MRLKWDITTAITRRVFTCHQSAWSSLANRRRRSLKVHPRARRLRRSCRLRMDTYSSIGCVSRLLRRGRESCDVASFMADSQVPWGVEALGGAITQPAWRTKPSWYLITTEDKMIPPDAQRAMSKRAGSTVVEVKSSHSVFLSHPQAVAHLIEQAANGALAATKEGATNAAAH